MTTINNRVLIVQGGSTLYTLDNEVLSLRFKRILNGIGEFSVTLPAKKGTTSYYNNINLNDTVKFWIGKTAIPGSPTWQFIGKIYAIEGIATENQGYSRVLKGLDLGEVLKRRIKHRYRWYDVDADDIADDVCDDTGLSKSIVTDTNDETITSEHDTYYDILQKNVDYWISAGTQIKHDWHVDVDNYLQWRNRPIRTAGVETFTEDDNILGYRVLRDLSPVKNKITVYGDFGENTVNTSELPIDETWTEGIDIGYWVANVGSRAWSATAQRGTYSMRMYSELVGGNYNLDIQRNFLPTMSHVEVGTKSLFYAPNIHFYYMLTGGNIYQNLYVYLLAPNAANSWHRSFTVYPSALDTWIEKSFTLPTDMSGWTSIGTPIKEYITAIRFYSTYVVTYDWFVDDLNFRGARFYVTASDSTSQTNYGIREMVHIADILKSYLDCQKRAETLLYQFKNPVTQIEMVVDGNSNVLIGDRLSITLTPENISAANYDVIEVEQNITRNGGWRTLATMVNQADVRKILRGTNQVSSLRYTSQSLARAHSAERWFNTP